MQHTGNWAGKGAIKSQSQLFASAVLNEDWSDYDNRKIREGQDAKDFLCTETWEVDFLVKKIKKAYPNYTEFVVRYAIQFCSRQLAAPYSREEFIGRVIRQLRGLVGY